MPFKHALAYGWHFWDSQLVQTVLTESLTHLQLLTQPLHSPLPLPPTYPYNVPSVILQWFGKGYSKSNSVNQLQIVIKHQLKDCSSYTVYLVWLKSSTREVQWLEYLKLVFLEMPNVTTWSVFQKSGHKLILCGSLVCMFVCAYVCVCMSTPEAINNQWHDMTEYNQLNKLYSCQLAIFTYYLFIYYGNGCV